MKTEKQIWCEVLKEGAICFITGGLLGLLLATWTTS